MTDWTPAEKIDGLVGAARGKSAVSPLTGSDKDQILQEILKYSGVGPFKIARGSDTDIEIANEATNCSWCSGKKLLETQQESCSPKRRKLTLFST
jgi:hypothetical protein